jgi:hypothetical protein
MYIMENIKTEKSSKTGTLIAFVNLRGNKKTKRHHCVQVG